MTLRTLPFMATLSFLVLLASCGGGGADMMMSTAPPPPPGPPPPPPATGIGVVAGDVQIGGVGLQLPVQLKVIVQQANVPVAGTAVLWQTSNGSVSPMQSVTGADGTATTTWTMSSTPGPQMAEAFAGSTSGAAVNFNALAAVTLPGPTVEVDLFTAGGTRFDPGAIVIPAGTTVNWVWQDGTHSVVSNGSPSFPSTVSADTPHTYSFTFTTPGTYRYYCLEHGGPGSGMYGVVVVQ